MICITSENLEDAYAFEHGKGIKYWRTIDAARNIVSAPVSAYPPKTRDRAAEVILAAAKGSLRELSKYTDLHD